MKAMNDQLVETRDALWGEMQLAKKIQTVLIPSEPHIDGFEVSAFIKPTDDVGGDYYDVINAAGKDWLIVGDVAGHGVSAGLIMMMVHTAIRVAIEQNPGLAPDELLTVVNKIITYNIKQIKDSKYMTIVVFAVMSGGKLTFSRATPGHLFIQEKNRQSRDY